MNVVVKTTRKDVLMVIIVVVAVGLVLYFSIPIFFSPGGWIGEPTCVMEEGQQPAAAER